MAERADSSHLDATTEEPHRHERPEDWGWNGSWGKWALLVWIPLSLLSLAMILYSRHILRTKSSAIEDKIRSAHRDDTTP